MQQIRLENHHYPSMYRTLHVDEESMLTELAFIILTSFDLIGHFEEQKAFFTAQRRHGKPVNIHICIDPDVEVLYDADEQGLNDWLVTTNDVLIYHLGDEIKVRVVLENIIDEHGVSPICIEGQGTFFSPNKKNIDLQKINTNLSIEHLLEQLDFEEMQQLLEPDYAELLQLSAALNKIKPWHYFNNENIIAIQLEEFDETFYVAVMGAGEQEFGLLVYDEEFGYHSLAAILEGKLLPADFHFNLSALSVNFVDRANLDKADYALIKECGMSFRGKNNWHQFRVYTPGMLPTLPAYVEVEVLKSIIQAMLDITKLRMNGWQYPAVPQHTFPTFTVSETGELSPMVLRKVPYTSKSAIHIALNDIELAHYKRKPKSQFQLEFDLFYLPFATPADDAPNTFIFPTVFILFDRATGEALHHDILPFPKHAVTQQQLFWRMLVEMPVRPAKLFVSKEMQEAVVNIAKKAGVELVVSELPHIQHFRQFMLENPPID